MVSAVLAICFAAGAGFPWLAWMMFRAKRLPVAVIVDDDDPRPSDVARYFAEIAARLDERPEKMRVVLTAPAGMALDIGSDGRLAVLLPGCRTCRFELRRRWIADHPVPFDLGPRTLPRPFRWLCPLRPAVLYIDPVDSNRFRVSSCRRHSVPFASYAFLSLAVALAIVLVSPLLASVALGMLSGCAVMSFTGR